MKTQIKQIAFLLVILFVFSFCEDDDSAFKTKSSSKEVSSFKVLTTSNTFESQDVTAAISQRQILKLILDVNPNNTLDWNLREIENLGSLTGVTTNSKGRIIELNLNKNVLYVLPPEIGRLTSLKKLSAEANFLNELPIEIWNLINLRHLNLSSNQLTSIPEEIKNLINLKYLNLNFNRLVTIPQEINLLTALEEIGLFE